MQVPEILDLSLWLIANDKEAEFMLWCKRHHAEPNNPCSILFFKNEQIKEAV